MFLMAGFSYAQSGASKPADENIEEVFVSHTVTMGETVVMVAKKYKITPQDVYEYNPAAVDGLTQSMSLKIPMHRTVDMSKPKKAEDKIEAKAKNTDIASAANKPTKPESKLADLPATNAVTAAPSAVATAPVAATVSSVPAKTAAPVANANVPGRVIYTVKGDDTLVEIAYKHNISVEAVTAMNQEKLANGLVPGTMLAIVPGRELYVTPLAPLEDETTIAAVAAPVTVTHHVVSGETLHGLCRKYKTTIPEITAFNQKALKHGLQAGQTLKIPSNTAKAAEDAAIAAATPVIAAPVAVTAEVAQTPVAATPVAEVKVPEVGPLATATETASAEVITPLVLTEDEAEPIATGTSIAERVKVQHKVQNGETLTGLARKYHTTIEEITQYNKKKLRNGLQAGQVIVIPSQSSEN